MGGDLARSKDARQDALRLIWQNERTAAACSSGPKQKAVEFFATDVNARVWIRRDLRPLHVKIYPRGTKVETL